ncbi:MAG TPA: GerMN domain-containing protein [Terriglobales bacterium]|nr:GerMN domain-containing protein [Terriglobales bacterium]
MIPRHLLVAAIVLCLALLGMVFYGLHLKREAEQLKPEAPAAKLITPPVAGSTEHIPLYVPDDARGLLLRRDVVTPLTAEPGQRAAEVLRALFAACQEKSSTHPLAPGADVKSVFVINGNTAVIDVNAEFADRHQSGILVEELTLAAMARTLAENIPGITRLRILVEGKQRDTLAGHADLTSFYVLGSNDWAIAER